MAASYRPPIGPRPGAAFGSSTAARKAKDWPLVQLPFTTRRSDRGRLGLQQRDETLNVTSETTGIAPKIVAVDRLDESGILGSGGSGGLFPCLHGHGCDCSTALLRA